LPCHQQYPSTDGITSYNADVIFTPKWLSTSSKYNTLFMFKIYMSNEIIDINEVINYFELPIDTIRLFGDKILTDNNSDENAIKSINSLNLKDIILLMKMNSTLFQRH